jgi:UDP-N-acetyl-2-amino-2-deoxyglucuronate dehydrogenase
LELAGARVKWFLSVDKEDLPSEIRAQNKSTFRSITIDGEEVEFSEGFTDLHTIVYKETLAGRGFGLETARPSVVLAHDIREMKPIGVTPDSHPLLGKLKL